MNLQKLFISKVLPLQSSFKYCDIYNYEIKKIEQKLAESLNTKNIHMALDIPDFRHVKDSKIAPYILKLSFEKLKIFNDYTLESNDSYFTLINKKIKYQIILFEAGKLPMLNIKENNIMILMYQPGFKRVFFCGILELKDKLTNFFLTSFYDENCEKGSKYFINFEKLKNTF